jgi:hypothetical protein
MRRSWISLSPGQPVTVADTCTRWQQFPPKVCRYWAVEKCTSVDISASAFAGGKIFVGWSVIALSICRSGICKSSVAWRICFYSPSRAIMCRSEWVGLSLKIIGGDGQILLSKFHLTFYNYALSLGYCLFHRFLRASVLGWDTVWSGSFSPPLPSDVLHRIWCWTELIRQVAVYIG